MEEVLRVDLIEPESSSLLVLLSFCAYVDLRLSRERWKLLTRLVMDISRGQIVRAFKSWIQAPRWSGISARTMGGLISWKISWGRKGVRGVRRGVEIGSAADWNWQGDHPLEPSPIINESLAQDDSSSNLVTEQEDRKKLPGEVYHISGYFRHIHQTDHSGILQCEYETTIPQINSVAGKPIRVIV